METRLLEEEGHMDVDGTRSNEVRPEGATASYHVFETSVLFKEAR